MLHTYDIEPWTNLNNEFVGYCILHYIDGIYIDKIPTIFSTKIETVKFIGGL